MEWLVVFLLFVAVTLTLIHYKPADLPGINVTEGFDGMNMPGVTRRMTEGFDSMNMPGVTRRMTEGFAVATVDPARVPACVERSTDAQSLLARFATLPATDDNAAELRLLVSKLCCMETDIIAPSAGSYRTLPLQFRTSHDLEPASTTVTRCLSRSLPQRDIDLALEKFQHRGDELLNHVVGGADCSDAKHEFASVLDRLRRAFATCKGIQPSMDHPIGARDMGFWESRNVANLSVYQGISAST